MEKRRNIFIIIILAVATLLVAWLALTTSSMVQNQAPLKRDLAAEKTPTPEPPKEKVTDFLSPDGAFTLTVENLIDTSGSVHQTFFVTSTEEGEKTVIYETESNIGDLITVPENTFSPTNKYVFLTYQESGKSRYIVLQTDGEDIKKNSETVDFTTLFEAKYPNFVITDVTGWGGYGLIVVNTDTPKGKTGPSWWFDVAGSSFIRLSTRFN